jgi:predicted lipoprotein with Yx(FWY)xxD motif
MKRKHLFLVGLALLLVVCSSAIAATRGASARRADSATLELRETGLGKILTNASGFTVFEFTKDKKKRDVCMTISGCTETWPPLIVSGSPVAGSGVSQSLLGTTKLTGGEEQVTYAGRPVYLYRGDSGPEETSYVGVKEFGGTWYALNAKGKAVKQAKHSKGW